MRFNVSEERECVIMKGNKKNVYAFMKVQGRDQ